MKTFIYALLTALLLAFVAGCGSDKDKDINRHRDMPRAAPPEEKK